MSGLRYRHTLGQLRGLLEKLHELINPMKEWERKARKLLKREGDGGKKEGGQQEVDGERVIAGLV